MVLLERTVATVFPLKWRFYPSNISAISLREREILARKSSQQYQNYFVSIVILWICIFILEMYEFCIDWLCNELSVTFSFLFLPLINWQDRIDRMRKLSFLKCLVIIIININIVTA